MGRKNFFKKRKKERKGKKTKGKEGTEKAKTINRTKPKNGYITEKNKLFYNQNRVDTMKS